MELDDEELYQEIEEELKINSSVRSIDGRVQFNGLTFDLNG